MYLSLCRLGAGWARVWRVMVMVMVMVMGYDLCCR